MPDSDSRSDPLAAHLARLDTEACTGLVADLWAARGFETTREDGVVVATRDGEATALYPVGRARLRSPDPPGRPVDAVVTPSGDVPAVAPDVPHVAAADLAEMLLYAVDRPTARTLCERYVGAPPETLRPPATVRLRRGLRQASAVVASDAPGAVPVVGAVVLAVVLVAGLGLSGAPLETPSADAPGAPDRLSGPDGSASTDTGADAVGTPPVEVTAIDATGPDSYAVPGLGPRGITDPVALSEAHRDVLANRSYSLWIDTYRLETGEPNATTVQTDTDVTVAGGRYLAAETRVEGDERELVGAVYYDGARWYSERRVGGVDTTREIAGSDAVSPGQPTPDGLNRAIVLRYLSTPETVVADVSREDGTTQYRIEGRGPVVLATTEPVRNYAFLAIVDETGFVHTFSAQYEVGNTRVRFQWNYRDLGGETLLAPEWVDQASTDAGAGTVTDDGPIDGREVSYP
jgi:hypothetical protein